MLVGLIGGGDGLKELINKNLDGFATNSAVVWAQQTTIPYHGFRKGRQWVMNYDDVKRLKAHVPELASLRLPSRDGEPAQRTATSTPHAP